MMKRLLAALLFMVPSAAWATCSSVPYTFTPNTLAQSGQVNANFAALVNCANTIDASQITTGVLPVARGGTGTTSWTTGSVVFAASSSALGQDNPNFFYDPSSHRLTIADAIYSGTQSGNSLMQMDLAQTDGTGGLINGNATALFTPPLNNTNITGMAILPNIGSLTTTSQYSSLVEANWSEVSQTPISNSVKGKLVNFEANMYTAQTTSAVDVPDTHLFGGTCTATAGLGCSAFSAVVENSTVTPAAASHIINGSVLCDVSGSCNLTTGVEIGNGGAHKAGQNFKSDGSWISDFASSAPSAAGENDTFHGFIGAGDSTASTPFGIFGNVGGSTVVVGSFSGHDLEFRAGNAILGRFLNVGGDFQVGPSGFSHGVGISEAGTIYQIAPGGNLALSGGGGGGGTVVITTALLAQLGVTMLGQVTMTGLSGGAAAKYACFDGSGNLIAQVAAC